MERHSLRRFYGRQILKGALFASTALVLPAIAPRLAFAQIAATTTPQGGVVVGGSASIAQTPGSTTINQSSERGAINWQSFDVGSAAKVQFNQPDAAAVTLNRVTGGNLSQINGQINANGQIVLINQSGVVFGKGSQVNAESVVVSTSDIPTSDFMAGKTDFTGTPQPGAKIINDGNITARNAGLVGLIAPQVANNGVITAELGQVVLAGASAFTLDMYGDRLISLDVTQAVRAVDVGGKPVPALVTNSGLIIADGGKITMTAADADALVTQLIDAGGTIRADTAGGQTGTISVSGVGGNISIAGNLLARGTATGTGGGAIEALTDGTVSVAAGADIDVSGAAGGGYAAIGTDLTRAQTGPSDMSAPAAASVSIASGATIHADATQLGNAGKVTLLSQNATNFAGAITAQGGPQGGNGGLSEISSRGVISLSGTVLDTAINGQAGEILLDPGNVTIATGGTANTTGSTIAPSYLDGLLGTVVITSSGTIYVLDGLDMSKASALTLNATDDITIAAAVTVAGSIDIQAGGSLYIGPQLDEYVLITPQGLTVTSPGGITASSADLNGNTGIAIDAAISTSGALSLSSNGPITEGSVIAGTVGLGLIYVSNATTVSGGIVANTLSSGLGTLANGTTINLADGPVSLVNNDNTIAAINQFTLQTGEPFALLNTGSLNIGSFSAASASIAAGSFDFSGPVDVTGDLQLQSAGAVIQTGGSLVAGTLNGFGSGFGGDVSLTSTGNDITTLGLISLSGGGHDLFIDDGQILTIAGSITAPTFALGGAGATEISGGTLFTPTLQSFGSISGDVILGNANAVTVLNGLTLGGNFLLNDAVSLAVNGPLSATGTGADVLLTAPTITSNGSGGITLSGTGTRLGLAANSFSLGATLSAATIEIAPSTASAQTISAAEAAFLDAGTLLRLGAYTTFGGSTPTITANSLTFGTGGSLSATTLDLEAAGAINQPNGAVSLNVGTLLLDAGQITLAAIQNTINNLGSVTAANLILDDALDLNVRGNVSASGNITLTATQLTFNAPVTASGVLDLIATASSISQQSGTISAGTLTGTASSGAFFSSAGNVFHTIAGFRAGSLLFNNTGTADIDGFLSAASTIALEGAVAEISGGSIHATVLTSNGNIIAGNVFLTSPDNSVSTLTNFLVGSGDALDLDTNGLLNLAGTVSAPLLDLVTTGGGITQSGGSLIVTGSLTGSAGGDVALTGSHNTIDGIGAFTSGGTLSLADTATLAITGLVSAASEIDLSGTGFSESGAGALDATVFNIPSFTGLALLGGANAIGTINTVGGGANAVLALNDTGPLTLAGTLAAAGISFGGVSVTEVPGGEIDAGTLGGISLVTGSLILDQTNSIANVNGLTLGGSLVLADAKNLSVGTLLAQSATFSDSIDIQTINFSGFLSVAGSLELDYGQTGQGIFETGSITAGTLTGAAGAAGVNLTGVNSIASLAAFDDAGIFDLADQTALVISTPLSATAVSLSDAISLDIEATVSATTGAALFAAPLFSLGSAGAISVASGQEIGIATDVLDIAAGGTFSAPSGTLALAPYANTIIAIGGDKTGALNLDATTLAALQAATGTAALNELLIGQAAGHTAASIAILGGTDLTGFASLTALYAGSLITDTGTLNATTLAFSGGGFTQGTAGQLDAVLLDGDGPITGPVILTSTLNQIGTLGSIDSTASFALTDAAPLSVTGPVLAQDITLEDFVSIALGGNLRVINGTIQLITDALSQSAGSIDAGSGTVVLVPYTGAIGVDIGGTSTGGLQLTPALVEGIKAGQIDIGNAQGTVYAEGSVSLGSEELLLTGSAIEFAGTLEGLGLLSLASSGEVAEFSTSDVIDFASIAGLTGPIALIGNNSIGTIGDLSANGNIVLNNYESFIIDGLISTTGTISLEGAYYTETSNGVLQALVLNTGGTTIQGDVYLGGNNLIGTLTDFYVLAGSTFVFNNATALVVGDVTADYATLSATTLDFVGDVLSSQSLDLGAALVTQGAGEIDTRILSGSIGGNAILTQTNFINTLSNFSVANGSTLDLADINALTLSGADTASYATLNAFSLDFVGNFTATDQLALEANAVNQESGTITAGTLTSIGSIGGNVFLTRPNQISVVSNFSVGTGDTLDLADAGLLTLGGTVQAPFLTLSAGGIDFTGSVNATLADLASSAAVTQSSGIITAATLETAGNIAGDLTLGDANAIGTLGPVGAAGNIAIADTQLLDIAGLLSTTGTITLENTAGIDEIAGGTVAAGELTSGGTIGGSMFLTNSNAIADLAGFTLAPGATLNVTDGQALTISGPVTADFATFSATSLLLAGNLTSADSLVFASTGGISQTAGSIFAGTLSSGGTIGGNVFLTAAANTIAELGNLLLTSGATLDLADTGTLNIAGPVIADYATFSAGSLNFTGDVTSLDTLALASATGIDQTGGTISAGNLISEGPPIGGNVVLTSALNAITDLGDFSLASPYALELTDGTALTLGGAIAAASATFTAASLAIPGNLDITGALALLSSAGAAETGTINAGTLTSLNDTDGNVFLTASNTITTLGGFTVSPGSTLDLANTGGLTVAGPVSGSFITLSSGTIAIPGSITATDLALASTGSIFEDGGAIFATLLTSDGTIGGGVSLLGANAIGTLGSFALAGNFALSNTGTLIIAGLLATQLGDVTLEDSGTGNDITERGGSIDAATLDTGGTTLGGNLFLAGGNTIGALGAITLAAGETLNLVDTGLLSVAGTVNAPFDTLSVGSLAIAGALDGTLLVLAAQDGVSETTGTIAVQTIAGFGTIGADVNLANANYFDTLTNITMAPTASLDVVDIKALTLAGTILAPNASFTAPSLIFDGIIDDGQFLVLSGSSITTEGPQGGIIAGTLLSSGTVGNAFLTGDQNTIDTVGNFNVTASGTLALTNTGPLTLAGTIVASNATFSAASIAIPGFLTNDGVLALLSPGGISETGTIDAGTLTSLNDADGNVFLTASNSINTLGGFTVSAGSTLDLTDAGPLSVLTVAGPVNGSFITLASGTIAIPGDITATDLALAATGSIFEDGGAIFATLLTSGGTIGGGVSLLGANAIGTLGSFALDGNFALSDTSTLIIAGLLSTPGDVTLEDATADIIETGGSIAAATLDTGGTTLGGNLLLDGNNSLTALGTVTLASGKTLNLFDSEALTIAGPVVADDATLTAASLNIAGNLTSVDMLALGSSAGVTQTGGTITAGSLVSGGLSIGGNVFLTSALNNITDVGNFTIAGGDTLDLTDGGALTLAGGIVAPSATFSAAAIAIPGSLTDTLTLALLSPGGVTETGAITAGTLTSLNETDGNVFLTGARNTISDIGTFAVSAANTFALNDNGTLAVDGPLTGGVIALDDTGPLSILGSVAGTTVSLISTSLLTAGGFISATGAATLSGASILIPGTVAAGDLALESTGTILETGGTIRAATLDSGQTKILGDLQLLNGSNTIGTLGNIFLAGNFALANIGTLNIAGSLVTPGTVTLEDSSSIFEPTGLIRAATLNSGAGEIAGSARFTSAGNTIGSLGNLTVGSTLVLDDTGLLTIAGTVAAPFATYTAGTIAIDGALTGTQLAFLNDGLVTEATGGTIAVTTLTSGGGSDGTITLLQKNSIGTLGAFTATGNIALFDQSSLSIDGLVTTPGSITLEGKSGIFEIVGGFLDAAALNAGGTTIGGNVDLANANSIATLGQFAAANITFRDARSYAINGLVSAPGALILEGDGLSEIGGAIDAGTLASSGALAGSATLNGANLIATLSNFSGTGNLLLNDGEFLVLDGVVNLPGTLGLLDTSGIDQTAGGVTIAALTSDAGVIGGGVTLTGANSIATLGSFDAIGGLALNDLTALNIAAPVSLGGALALQVAGNVVQTGGNIAAAALESNGSGIGGALVFNQPGNLIAATGNLTVAGGLSLDDAEALDIAGNLYAGTASVVLNTGAFDLTQIAGSITAGTLEVPAAANVSLDDANAIATLGELSATGNVLIQGAAAIAGPVTATNATFVSDPGATLFVTGPINATDDVLLSSAAGIVLTGDDTAGNLFEAVSSAGGVSQSGGTISGGTVVINAEDIQQGEATIGNPGNATIDGAGITLTGGFAQYSAGVINAGNLTVYGSAQIFGVVSVANQLAIVNGSSIQDDAASLKAADAYFHTKYLTLDGNNVIGGALTANANYIRETSGYVSASAAALTGDAIDILGGSFSVTGLLAANNVSAGVNMTGGAITAGTLAISGYGLYQSGGVLNAGSLNVNAVQITQGPAGVIDAGTAAFNTSAGIQLAGNDDFTTGLRSDSAQFQQAGGTITAGYADISANDVGLNGVVSAGGLLVNAANFDQSAGRIDAVNFATIIASNTLALNGAVWVTGTLNLTGEQGILDDAVLLQAGAASILAPHGLISIDGNDFVNDALLINGAAFNQAAGQIAANSVSIAAAGELTASGGILSNTPLLLNAGGDILQPTGAVTAPSATLTAGNDITLNGADSFAGDLDLIAGGDILHNAGENLLTAATLTGSGNQLALFDAPTDFGTIGSFVLQDSTFSLDNLGTLTIIGPLVANAVSITAPGQITLDGTPNGGLFIAEPNGTKNAATPQPGDSVITVTQAPGAGNPLLLQTGVFYINTGPAAAEFPLFANQPATLFFTTTPVGDVQFAPSPPTTNGLDAPSITALFDLGGAGQASGNVDLLSLVILSGVATNLTGDLDGLSGQAAAGKGTVDPFPKPPFQFNACPIGSVNCIILPIETLPTNNPLQNFDIDQRKKRKLDKNVALPGVATRDF